MDYQDEFAKRLRDRVAGDAPRVALDGRPLAGSGRGDDGCGDRSGLGTGRD